MKNLIIFNHFYRLKHDKKRSYILGPSYVDSGYKNKVASRWASKVHPFFDISKDQAKDFLDMLYNWTEPNFRRKYIIIMIFI
jgi:hypothetical protein